MRKRWCSDPDTIRRGMSIADGEVPVCSFRRFDTTQRFPWRNNRAPAYAKKMCYERLNILHGVFLDWWRRERMICLVRTFGHIFPALFNDAQALPHFFYTHDGPVKTITIAA